MSKNFVFVVLLAINSFAYANVDPKAYIINTPNTTMNSFSQGFELGNKIRREKAERIEAEQLKTRESGYRLELKKFYDNPETISRANLTRLMLIYPEYSTETSKIIDSLNQSGLLKD